jgi:hypothetical protein
MTKKKSAHAGDLQAYFAKAVRRAEKLEKTLLKIVMQSEPRSAAETLLASLKQGLEELRKGVPAPKEPSPPKKASGRRPKGQSGTGPAAESKAAPTSLKSPSKTRRKKQPTPATA